MQVSTDSVLLAAYVDGETINTLLDVGSGSGILSIILAKRFAHLHFTSIELDKSSYNIGLQNVIKNNLQHITCIEGDFTTTDFIQTFDAIVCNPPYFDNGIVASSIQRANARHTSTLSLKSLLSKSEILLKPNGVMYLCYPFNSCKHLFKVAESLGLYGMKLVIVKHKAASAASIAIVKLSKEPIAMNLSELILYNNDNTLTSEYFELTKELYEYR